MSIAKMLSSRSFNAVKNNSPLLAFRRELSYLLNSFNLGHQLLQPSSSSMLVEQLRWRKRATGRPITKQEKALRRQIREEKEAKRKEFSCMERLNNRRVNRLLSPSCQGPGRYDSEEEAKLKGDPVLDVIIRTEHKTQFYSIAEALEMHRQLQRPEMYNRPNAPVKIRFELNMNTEKATKMVPASDEIVPVPYPFPHNEKRTILAFAANKEKQEEAVEAGAELAVGPEMVKKILKGQFIVTDFDFCVAHSELAQALVPLRGLLRSKCPTKLNGALGDDLTAIIQKFMAGVKLPIKGDPIHPHWGLSDPLVGTLGMPNEQIEANIETIVEKLCAHRNTALGPFINRAVLMVIPGKTFFSLDLSKYEPEVKPGDLEKIEAKRSKRKKEKEKSAAKEEKRLANEKVASQKVEDMEHMIDLM